MVFPYIIYIVYINLLYIFICCLVFLHHMICQTFPNKHTYTHSPELQPLTQFYYPQYTEHQSTSRALGHCPKPQKCALLLLRKERSHKLQPLDISYVVFAGGSAFISYSDSSFNIHPPLLVWHFHTSSVTHPTVKSSLVPLLPAHLPEHEKAQELKTSN